MDRPARTAPMTEIMDYFTDLLAEREPGTSYEEREERAAALATRYAR